MLGGVHSLGDSGLFELRSGGEPWNFEQRGRISAWRGLVALLLLALWYSFGSTSWLLSALGFAKPEVYCQRNRKNDGILKRMSILTEAYLPSFWLLHPWGGHIQSILFATFLRPSGAVRRLKQRRAIVKSSADGGSFALDWWNVDERDAKLAPNAPVVLVLPGVVGKSNNTYIRRTAVHMARELGARTVAKSWRGLGCPLTTKRPETWDEMALQDLLDAIRDIRREVGPDVPLLGIGYSYGGSLLTTLAGRVARSEHTLCGIINVSGLFDVSTMMQHIVSSAGFYDFVNARVTVRNYTRFGVWDALAADAADGSGSVSATAASAGAAVASATVEGCCGFAEAVAGAAASSVGTAQPTAPSSEPSSACSSPKSARSDTSAASAFPLAEASSQNSEWSPLSQEQLAAIKSYAAFHAAVTLSFSGDATVDAYNQRLEAMQLSAIGKVNVPVLALLAKDDPLCPPSAWERALEAAARNPAFLVVVTGRGGHCGFFQGPLGDSWLDVLCEQFGRAVLSPPQLEDKE